MISKLPRWAWVGAWVLAFIAGIVNVVGLLGYNHQAVTHLTGNTSLLAEAMARSDGASLAHFGALIAAFVVGCVVSGVLIQDSALQIGYRYGVALAIASLLLFAAVPLLQMQSAYGMYAAACACGLQNAMISTFSGAVIRTTHLSGMFTDLGIYIGHTLRGMAIDKRRLGLIAIVVSGFFIGGVIGALSFSRFSYATLFMPATLTACASIAYGLIRLRRRKPQ